MTLPHAETNSFTRRERRPRRRDVPGMLNFLWYYPRLVTALVLRPAPHSHATLQHWVLAHILFMWNKPWHHATDTVGMECVSLATKKSIAEIDPHHWKTRLLSAVIRSIYLVLILTWPFWALLIALGARRHRYVCWNNLIDNLTAVIVEPRCDYSIWREPLSSISFYIPLLYICSRTGIYLPDAKHETDKYCRQHGIATPRVYSAADVPIQPGEYIVKPVRGSYAKGIVFTLDPAPYLADNDVIVQEIVRNPLEQRRIWGTDALASIRCFTATTAENNREFVGAVLRIPMNESRFDNTRFGNGFARVDRGGRLERAYTDKELANGFSFHPLTNERIEGVRLARFAECVQLAFRTHEALAPGLPVLNSDIALTEQGPMLIEINRAPGQYWNMYSDGFSEKCVAALCRGIARAARQSEEPHRRIALFGSREAIGQGT